MRRDGGRRPRPTPWSPRPTRGSAAKHRIASWVRLLALRATSVDGQPRAVTVGRGGQAEVPAWPDFRSMPPDIAVAHLCSLVDLYRRDARAAARSTATRRRHWLVDKRARSEWETTGWTYDQRGPGPGPRLRPRREDAVRSAARRATACDEDGPEWASDEPSSDRPLRHAAVGRPARRSRSVEDCDRTEPVRRLRPAAVGHHLAGGQRRHGQDVHDRRPRRPLCRRRARRSTACCSSRSGGWPPASCAPGCASAWSRRGGAAGAARTACAPAPTTRCSRLLADGRRDELAVRRAPSRRGARRLRRRDDRHHPRVLPAGAQRHRRGRRRRPGRRRSSRTSTTSSTRWSTTCTCASSSTRYRRRSCAGIARDIGRAVVGQPAAAIVPDAGRRTAGGDARPAGPRRARRGRATQATAARPDLRRPAHPAARRPARPDGGRTGCGAAVRRRDGRRVPGHRPGAVGHPPHRVRRRRTTLVLIGDPKQAIYSFRGADVHTYLAARPPRRHGRDARPQLAQRRRRWSTAYDALFDGITLGHPGIEYRTVHAADAHRDRGCATPRAAALRCAWCTATTGGSTRRRPGLGERRRPAGRRWPPTSPPTSS